MASLGVCCCLRGPDKQLHRLGRSIPYATLLDWTARRASKIGLDLQRVSTSTHQLLHREERETAGAGRDRQRETIASVGEAAKRRGRVFLKRYIARE